MNERRAALVAESKSPVEIAKITGEEWKNMTEKQKAPYEKVAKQKNEKYTQEMEFYKQNKEEEAENAKKEEDELFKVLKQEALELLKKKEKTETIIKKTKEDKNKKKEEKKNKKFVDPNKPKGPASSFLIFSKETRKELSKEKPRISNAQTKPSLPSSQDQPTLYRDHQTKPSLPSSQFESHMETLDQPHMQNLIQSYPKWILLGNLICRKLDNQICPLVSHVCRPFNNRICK